MLSPPLINFGNPFFHPGWSVGESHAGRPDALDKHEASHPLWKRSRVEKRYRAAHGVADELHCLDPQPLDNAIEIQDIVGKMIITAGTDPAAVAVAAAVGRDDPERLFDQFLQGGDEGAPAVGLV